ncbi:hypothetical protein B0O80DRAFT_495630 [Mortierella sp. GBAus27b]|nr:hypothetical protein BGX31_003395 [Mortierella sp. GBA43]KAI8358995.1 hypothetical protein B0O80DRAFT_495630 [Mortierella sp. GBAus27b]
MERTQAFRLNGGMDIVELDCEHIDGRPVVYWADIQFVFPTVSYVKNGNKAIQPMRDSNRNLIEPMRIMGFPDVVLDVVVSASVGSPPVSGGVGEPATVSVQDDVVEHLRVASTSDVTSITSSFGKASEPEQSAPHESKAEKQLVASLPSSIQAQVVSSSNVDVLIVQAIRDGQVDQLSEQLIACFQELKDEIAKNHELTSRVFKLQEALNASQEEMKQLQIRALSQLALLQNRVQALMTQTYELHEYPIPRLFVIVPMDAKAWNPRDVWSNKFRLRFLCECGEHTKSANSRIPHDIHLAPHEGYEIVRSSEFCQSYGPYVLTILKMLRFGISVAGASIPAFSRLVFSEPMAYVDRSLDVVTRDIQYGMDQTISGLDRITVGMKQPEDHVALEGADLRRLKSFLKIKDGSKALGDLYRIVTTEGHVKWVCSNHYRENRNDRAAKAFIDTLSALSGSFDENVGRVNIHLHSKLEADQFYPALEKVSMSAYELKIVLDWDTVHNDFKTLQDALEKTKVGALELDLRYRSPSSGSVFNRALPYDPIFDMMRRPSIHSITIKGAPKDFFQRSNFLSTTDEFTHLRRLEIDLTALKQDAAGIRNLVSRIPNITHLKMKDLAVSTIESLEGSVDTAGGRVKLHLGSKIMTELICLVMEKVTTSFVLDVTLTWQASQSDFESLRQILGKTNVNTLNLCAKLKENSNSDYSSRTKQHDSLFDIMRHTSTQSVTITGTPEDFVQQSSLLSRSDNFPKMKHLDMDISALRKHIAGIRVLVSRATNLSSLRLRGADDSLAQVYNAIAELHACPITFDNLLRISPPTSDSPPTETPPVDMVDLLSVYGDRIEILGSDRSGSTTSTEAEPGLKELKVWQPDQRLGDLCIGKIAAIVSRSRMRKLEIHLGDEEGRVRILEGIQWEHIRNLEIYMRKKDNGTGALITLKEGMDKMSGQVQLERFKFWTFDSAVLEAELFATFLNSTRLKGLETNLTMTPEHTNSLLLSTNLSRLRELSLQLRGFSEEQVNVILDCLQGASSLLKLVLSAYTPTEDQIMRMKGQGIALG